MVRHLTHHDIFWRTHRRIGRFLTIPSTFSYFDNCFGKGLWSLLRQIVPDAAADEPVRIFSGEFLGIRTDVRMRRTVGVTFKSNGGHRNVRSFSKPLFQGVVFPLALSQPNPPSVIIDHDGNVVRIVEGRRSAIKRGFIEVPFRRSELPNEFREVMSVFFVAGPATVRGKIILVPLLELSLGRQRYTSGLLAPEQITAH